MTKDFEKLYSPSLWSKTHPADTVVEIFCEKGKSGSTKIKDEIPFEENIKYGKDEGELLDNFGRDTIAEGSPLFIFIHGGYWMEGSKDSSCHLVKVFWKNGIRVMVAGYDLSPKVSLKTIIRQMKDLCSYVLNYAESHNVKKVWWCGHSAGAHLAASLVNHCLGSLSARSLTMGFVLISGIYDLSPLISTSINETLQLSQEDAAGMSPLMAVKDSVSQMTFLIVVAEHDSPSFHQQSALYSHALSKVEGNVFDYKIPGVDHFDIITNMENEDFILNQIIIEAIHKCS